MDTFEDERQYLLRILQLFLSLALCVCVCVVSVYERCRLAMLSFLVCAFMCERKWDNVGTIEQFYCAYNMKRTKFKNHNYIIVFIDVQNLINYYKSRRMNVSARARVSRLRAAQQCNLAESTLTNEEYRVNEHTAGDTTKIMTTTESHSCNKCFCFQPSHYIIISIICSNKPATTYTRNHKYAKL